MRTRRGTIYYSNGETVVEEVSRTTKRRRTTGFFSAENFDSYRRNDNKCDAFDELHDDLVIYILSKISSAVRSPSDFANVLLTCKRLNNLGMNSMVLAKASEKVFAIKARKWSESTHRFLKLAADSGNAEACYTLGMIKFYCLKNRGGGASLMAKAAISFHAQALYSLAVIQFNGSGGSKNNKDLRAGVALCARAAYLEHIDALRELGHCLQDGYGVRQNVQEGRRFLVQANARELFLSAKSALPLPLTPHILRDCCQLLSDIGCIIPAQEPHAANRFLTEWFAGRTPGEGLRMCSHEGCGRPETRRHEFRRCSVCGAVNYCSRACQALDWKMRHKEVCFPVERWLDEDGVGDANANGVNEQVNDVAVES